MSWESRITAVNRLTKPPPNIHSCCNLKRTNANSAGVSATESSPYKVKTDKVLICQDMVVVVVGSSFSRERGGGGQRHGDEIVDLEGGLINIIQQAKQVSNSFVWLTVLNTTY